MKALIAYYTRTGENYFNGAIRSIDKGNTEVIAEKLQELTGADLFQIQQKVPYSDNYQECVSQAREEQENDARPELTALPEGEYDLIYLGFPNYCSTMPMAVFTFLESIPTDGVTIKPFCSNEGSGMGQSIRDIKRICPGAKVEAGLSVHGRNYNEAEMKAWM